MIEVDNTSYYFACKDFEGDTMLNNWDPIRDLEVIDLIKNLDLSNSSNTEGISSR